MDRYAVLETFDGHFTNSKTKSIGYETGENKSVNGCRYAIAEFKSEAEENHIFSI